MSYAVGDIIDKRFEITGLCSDHGGMGLVYVVEDSSNEFKGALALKICREESEDHIKRFRRECRLLESFRGNSKVVSILHSNTDHSPPYFVMKYYADGDLTNLLKKIQEDLEFQESIFMEMIDCISELHSNEILHRDIKPQNFLLDGDSLVVTDFGLGVEPGSKTRFTSTTAIWGTEGYIPPEFRDGKFKEPNPSGDIYMLGKSFYTLLTGQTPQFLMEEEVHPALFHVIERACELNHNRRYQDLSELKQALHSAYNVVLGRGGHLGEVHQLLSTINDKLENEKKYESSKIKQFVSELALVDEGDQIRICNELKQPFFSIWGNEKLKHELPIFLKIYRKMVEDGQYGFGYAEVIARNMKAIFSTENIPNKIRAIALEIAIDAADRMNRFAAMDTCTDMITSVQDDELGAHIAGVIQKMNCHFLSGIETSQCKCDSVRNAIANLDDDA